MTEAGKKISEGAARNRELRRKMEQERREDRAKIRAGLLSVLESPTTTADEKIRAAALYREYKFTFGGE